MRYVLLILLFAACTESKNSKSVPESEKVEVKEAKENEGWQYVEQTDKFGDKTGTKTLVGVFTGQMSNSATTNAELLASISISDSSSFIQFLEHGTSPASLPDSKFINIDYKLSNGDVKTIKHFIYKGYITESSGELHELLKTENSIKSHVDLSRVNSYSKTKYTYTIDGLSGLTK